MAIGSSLLQTFSRGIQPGERSLKSALNSEAAFIRQGRHVRTLKIIEHISLDGIIQAPGGPEEDGDYPYGGWAAPYDDDEGGEAILAAHGGRFDLLLGRRTYDIWAGFWPKIKNNSMADSLNAATKYVATRRPDTLEWGPVQGLGPDLVDDVHRIKASDGPDLILWGSSTLTSVLLEHGLADQVLLIVYPILLGQGKRLFADGTPPRELTLAGTKGTPSGILINTYRCAGPLRTGSFEESDGRVIQRESLDGDPIS